MHELMNKNSEQFHFFVFEGFNLCQLKWEKSPRLFGKINKVHFPNDSLMPWTPLHSWGRGVMIFLRLKGLSELTGHVWTSYILLFGGIYLILNEPCFDFNVLNLQGLLDCGEFRVHCELLSPCDAFVLSLGTKRPCLLNLFSPARPSAHLIHSSGFPHLLAMQKGTVLAQINALQPCQDLIEMKNH